MDMNAKVTFTVKGLGFPFGKIYKMHVWLPNETKRPGAWIDENADKIKDEMKDMCIVHSIELNYVSWSNTNPKNVDFGDLVLESEKDATPSSKKKSKKVETKPVTDIKKIDLPNIDKDDLNKLKEKIDVELFKRENELSDDVYNFWFVNQDLVSVDEVKEICKEHGADDLFLLRKMEIRKLVEKKVPTT